MSDLRDKERRRALRLEREEAASDSETKDNEEPLDTEEAML